MQDVELMIGLLTTLADLLIMSKLLANDFTGRLKTPTYWQGLKISGLAIIITT